MTSLLHAGGTVRDLTDPVQNARVLEVADELVADPIRLELLLADRAAVERVALADPVELEAAACAASARAIAAIATPVHLSVVWAMYQETERILRHDQHPHGEDFLFEKLRQIAWLADHNSLLTWDLIAVDDGCPSVPSSADVAASLVAEAGLERRVSVLRLADAIGQRLPVTRTFGRLDSTADSRKGGAITYGMWAAVHQRAGLVPDGADHVVLYTDADLSTNLAQAGTPMLDVLRGAAASAGQRYGVPGSVLVTASGPMTEPTSTGAKPDRMIVLFRHAVRAMLVPTLGAVLDTQAGFKAFSADVVRRAIHHLDAYTETFDVELLLHAADQGRGAIAVPPIVFTEDFAASNFPSVDPSQRHLDMLHQIVDIHDRLVAPSGFVSIEAATLRNVIASMRLDGYVRLIEALRAADDPSADDTRMFEKRWSVDQIEQLTR